MPKENPGIIQLLYKPISYKVKAPRGVIKKVRNYHKADWAKFGTIIDSELPSIRDTKWSQVRIENELKSLYECIDRALDITCPKRCRRIKLEARWWNEDCEKAKCAYLQGCVIMG